MFLLLTVIPFKVILIVGLILWVRGIIRQLQGLPKAEKKAEIEAAEAAKEEKETIQRAKAFDELMTDVETEIKKGTERTHLIREQQKTLNEVNEILGL